MLAYILDKNISGEKILKDIQKLVRKYHTDSQDQTKILTITIKTITSDNHSFIPKLELKT
jgi:hypothetical protein